jgi:hypothetical protein
MMSTSKFTQSHVDDVVKNSRGMNAFSIKVAKLDGKGSEKEVLSSSMGGSSERCKRGTYGGEVSQYNYKCKYCPMSYTGTEKPDVRFRLHEKVCKRTNNK